MYVHKSIKDWLLLKTNDNSEVQPGEVVYIAASFSFFCNIAHLKRLTQMISETRHTQASPRSWIKLHTTPQSLHLFQHNR